MKDITDVLTAIATILTVIVVWITVSILKGAI